MGWQDDAIVEAAPAGKTPAWMNDAVVEPAAKPGFDMSALPNRPGGILQMVGEPVAKALAPLVDPVNRGLVSLAGGITKGASKIGLIKEDDPIAQAGFDLTPQQLIETHGNQVKDMTGSPWAGAIAKKAIELGPASPGSWVVPAALAPVAQGVTNAITGNARSNVAEALAKRSQNATRDANIRELQANGYVAPPSILENTNPLNTALESFAGKAALKQEAARRGAVNSTRLAREELGIPSTQALSNDAIAAAKIPHNKVYQDIADLSPNASNLLDAFKDAKRRYNQYASEHATNNTVAAYDQAQRYKGEMSMIEAQLQKEAAKMGRSDLMQQLPEARTQLAKINDVSRAMNETTGQVSASKMGMELGKDKPLSGNLEIIGKYKRALPQIAQDAEKIPAPDVSHVNAIASAILGAGGAATLGPGGAALAALPLARPFVRRAILSQPYQRFMAHPSYGDGALTQAFARTPPVQIDPMVAAILARGVTSQNGDY